MIYVEPQDEDEEFWDMAEEQGLMDDIYCDIY